jgi:hypothetical protein
VRNRNKRPNWRGETFLIAQYLLLMKFQAQLKCEESFWKSHFLFNQRLHEVLHSKGP